MLLSLFAYNLILTSLLPLSLMWGLWRLIKGKSRTGYGQRLGLIRQLVRATERRLGPTADGTARPRIWVHACSAGEVSAIRPVLKNLREQQPEALIFLSIITPTGQAQAKRSCPQADAIFYFPFDIVPCVWAALYAVRPDLCLIAEKELWPNFLAFCRMYAVPVISVNSLVSERTLARAQCFRGFVRWLMGLVSFYSVQTERDRERLIALGVPRDRIGVDGNTKFDQLLPAPGKEEYLARLLGWLPDSLTFVAGSTHAGEDELVLEAFFKVRRKHPSARLLIAPRHPERVPQVCAAVEQAGMQWVRRSELQPEGSDPRRDSGLQASKTVIILDTIGELLLVYRLCRAAFVGGSVVPQVGGHNPLEVAAEGKPAFFGPHMKNCRDIAELLCREGVGFAINNASELADGWKRAIEDEAWLAQVKEQAGKAMRQHAGGSERATRRALALLASKQDECAAYGPASVAVDSAAARQRNYFLNVIENREQSPEAELLRLALGGLSHLYRIVLAANLALYDFRILRRKQAPCPVIVVGNITTGGTGKTMATTAICQWLLARGLKPAVLSRGYGGTASTPRLVFDGEHVRLGPAEAGDEPFLLAVSMPTVPVFVGKDRRRSAQMALDLGAQVLVLDDGSQYWKMERDAEIILVDALNPFGNGRLLPRGLLREPLSALCRAQAIWLTHADMVSEQELTALEEQLAELAPEAPISRVMHQPAGVRDFATGDRVGFWTLEGKRVLALSGLGNPASFEEMLRKLGLEVVSARFPDHYRYREAELVAVLEKAGPVHSIITTAKDAVRLPATLRLRVPIRVLEVKLAGFCSKSATEMDDLIEEALGCFVDNMTDSPNALQHEVHSS